MTDRSHVLGMPGYVPPTQTQPPTIVLAVVVGDHGAGSTITAVRYFTTLEKAGDPLFGEEPVWRTEYTLLNREELPASTSYPAITARVNVLARRLFDRDFRGDYHVLVDASDVGRPVVDSIRQSIIPQVHVTSVRVKADETADLSILWRLDATVGLTYLVSRLRAILQASRLHVPAALAAIPEALSAYSPTDGDPPADIRALALACASEFQAVSYDLSPDELPSPAL